MPAADPTAPPAAPPRRLSRLWLMVYALILAFTAALAVETALRIPFPWDLYAWSESPFLTNLLKLDAHQPIYTAPADGNSFVYSPGLEYLCFALLKPFGLELDIRWCRLISTLLGLAAAGVGALAILRLARSVISAGRTKLFFLVTWGLVWLVLSKNFMADIDHPDNLHALHATLLLWLTLAALESKRFGLALLTMFIAGVGVFTKQTEALSFLGPLAAFTTFNPWGLKRWLLLAAVGAGTVAVSLYVLWLPEHAKFWTFELLTQHQRMWPSKSYSLLTDLLSMDRAVLLCLGLIAFACLWSAGGAARRYLVVWFCVGLFAVAPNVSAYLKTMGIWNNLIIFEIWLILIVWPFFGMLADALPALKSGRETSLPWDRRTFPFTVCALMLLLLCLLLPMKVPPRLGDYTFARTLESAIRADLAAGRKVLVSHTTAALIHAGVREVPLDRCNSILELAAGNVDSLSAMKSRLDAHYYDRIYLVKASWYHDDILADLNRNYQTNYIIPKSPYVARLIYGYGDLLSDDIPVLSPRTNLPPQNAR